MRKIVYCVFALLEHVVSNYSIFYYKKCENRTSTDKIEQTTRDAHKLKRKCKKRKTLASQMMGCESPFGNNILDSRDQEGEILPRLSKQAALASINGPYLAVHA